MDNLISVIIPVYNTSSTLQRCVESIINNDYKNVEIILIDDCSKDSSLEVCRLLSDKYDNISYYHNDVNKGVSYTRNVGLQNCKGKYVLFIDSDDYVDENMIEKLIELYNKYDLDLVTAGIFEEFLDKNGKNTVINKTYSDEKFYNSKEKIKEDFVKLWDRHILYNISNKMYRMDIIKEHEVRFPNLNFGEDLKFNQIYLNYVNKYYNTENAYYHYIRERENSSTSSYNEKLFNIRIKEYEQFEEYFSKYGVNNEKSREFLSRRHLERIIGCIENVFNNTNMTFKERKVMLKDFLNHSYTIESLKYAVPQSFKTKIIFETIKSKNVTLIYSVGYIIHFVRKNFGKIFLKLKNSR